MSIHDLIEAKETGSSFFIDCHVTLKNLVWKDK